MTAAVTRVSLVEAWRRFWFDDVPPHSSALLRICLGGLGVLAVLTLTPIDTFWSTEGLSPVPGGGMGIRELAAGYDSIVARLLFAAALAAFACTLVGYQTSAAVAAAFAATLGMTFWNPLPLTGGHYVAAGLLFCLIWTESGEVLSIDAWRRRKAGVAPGPKAQAVWPLRLMRFQIAVIYLNSGLGKLYSPAWRDGSALHYVLELNTFARFPQVLAPEWDWIATAGTYVTLLWELAFPFLLFHRATRGAALVLGVLLHVGMALTMEVGLFSGVMLASYLAFLDPRGVAHGVTVFLPNRLNLSYNR